MHPTLAYLPSPRDGVWHLGAIPIRAYALCIIAGIVLAVWITERRWVARGGRRGTVSDIAVWAVVFGLVGGRLYHVLTDPELYFGAGRHSLDAFKVWQGGLGIWGAISLGGVGAWLGCRRRGIKLPPYADAAAPGIAVAQAVGRWGNWFNQELFGRPTTLPWGLKIDPGRPSTVPGAQAYHPTFLYESLWDLLLAAALVWADRRFKMGRGRVFALYVMGYTIGRVWIEALRIDTANHILGLRVNIWTSIIVFVGALIYFLRHPGPRETDVEPVPAAAAAAGEAPAGGATEDAEPAEPEAAGSIAPEPAADDLEVAEPGADAADHDAGDAAPAATPDAGLAEAAASTASPRPSAEPAAPDPDRASASAGDAGSPGAPDAAESEAETAVAGPAEGAAGPPASAPNNSARADRDGSGPLVGKGGTDHPTGVGSTRGDES